MRKARFISYMCINNITFSKPPIFFFPVILAHVSKHRPHAFPLLCHQYESFADLKEDDEYCMQLPLATPVDTSDIDGIK